MAVNPDTPEGKAFAAEKLRVREEERKAREEVYIPAEEKGLPIPTSLLDMRSMWNGNQPRTPGERSAAAMKDKDPIRFFDRLQKAEREWSEKVSKYGEVQQSTAASTVDSSSERCEELMERLLGEAL